jgi:hypothetical protein
MADLMIEVLPVTFVVGAIAGFIFGLITTRK